MWGLVAIVLLTFTTQCALASLVLVAASPDNYRVPSLYANLNATMSNRAGFSSREQQIDQFYEDLQNEIPGLPAANPFLGEGCTCRQDSEFEANACPYLPQCFLCEVNAPSCNITSESNSDITGCCGSDDVRFFMLAYFTFLSGRQQGRQPLAPSQLRQLWPWNNTGSREVQLPATSVSQSVAVSLAMVLIAGYVHREVARAHLLARIALTHIGCMPAFFTPLSLVGPKPLMNVSHWAPAAALLALPLMQIAAALAVLVAASTAFALASQTDDIISIIFNSAALLFVLELDNMMGYLAQERLSPMGPMQMRRTATLGLLLAEKPLTQTTSNRRCCTPLGHAYVALLGLLSFIEPVIATPMVAQGIFFADAINNCNNNLQEFCFVLAIGSMSVLRNSVSSWVSFAVLYTLTVALLFDPPLPTKSVAWAVAAKAALVANTATVSVTPDALELGNYFILLISGMSGLPWLALYAIAPWARTCHMAARAQRLRSE